MIKIIVKLVIACGFAIYFGLRYGNINGFPGYSASLLYQDALFFFGIYLSATVFYWVFTTLRNPKKQTTEIENTAPVKVNRFFAFIFAFAIAIWPGVFGLMIQAIEWFFERETFLDPRNLLIILPHLGIVALLYDIRHRNDARETREKNRKLKEIYYSIKLSKTPPSLEEIIHTHELYIKNASVIQIETVKSKAYETLKIVLGRNPSEDEIFELIRLSMEADLSQNEN